MWYGFPLPSKRETKSKNIELDKRKHGSKLRALSFQPDIFIISHEKGVSQRNIDCGEKMKKKLLSTDYGKYMKSNKT